MWYGKWAFAEFKGSIPQFFSRVDEGYRPEDDENSKKPPAQWKQLMTRCWERDPEQRPSAKDCNQELTTLSQGC